MDAVSALDAAACILAITEFVAKLLSTSQSLDGKDEHAIFETLDNLRVALSNIRIPSVPQQPSGSAAAQPPNHAPALQELISCRNASTALLGDIQNLLKKSPDESRQQPRGNDRRAWLKSRLAGTPYVRQAEQLSRVVTQQVDSILRSRISELSQSIEASEGEARYTRPEHESRVDTVSRDLQDLKLQLQKRSVNQEANSLSTFTEADVKMFRARLASLTEAEDALLADTIVSSLNYNSRSVRFDSIPQAHKDTFQWAFDSRLADWFASGNGTFWISGKPGSGKSTFMKFIAQHPRTRELLASWAGSYDTLAIAAHFFWIAGTPIQKSWQGLLQSLLFGLLHGRPSLVSLISPNRWAAAKAGQWQSAAEPWSVTELAVALRALATADHLSLRMCFFIDGLDEYNSDHAELCQVLHDMANSPYIKICLSSRRWPVFEKSFGNDGQESLDIHELTRNDIRNFINDQLQAHPRWIAEVSEDAALDKVELLDHIVAQANGVFLWAFLVTWSLREGLSNGESIRDLNTRFSQLPSDLDQLFKHMLGSVKPVDHSKMAGILQAAVHAFEPLHVDLYSELEKEFESQGTASKRLVAPAPQEGIALHRENTILSINEKTKGLLRVVYDRVEFLHRTVKDFALTKDVGEYLCSKLPVDYNGFASIAAAYLRFLRTARQDNPLVADVVRQGRGLNTGWFIAHLNQALVYASEALSQTEQPGSSQTRQIEELLDEYEAAIESMVRLGHLTIRGVNSRSCGGRLLFREALLRHNLMPYLAKRIREQPDFFDVFDESPLFAALTPMSRNSGESPAPVPGVLDILLRRGEDPNVLPRQPGNLGASDAVSPWVLFARSTMSVFNMLSGPLMFPALRWNDFLKDATFGRLMSHGADPNKPLLDRLGARTVFSHFLDISLSKFLGEECYKDYLLTLDAFLRQGASLGVPDLAGKSGSGAETAFGNLARRRPDESVLTSFCSELKGLQARLAVDPQRATFVSSVVEKLIRHCSGREEDQRELKAAISQGCPAHIASPLLRPIDSETAGRQEQGTTPKRPRDDGCDSAASKSMTRHSRSG
ncbi:small s [Fusarium albosuccineum]|uniref:Small s n=1 Tax=Fusarium albosuccineum TaxID=1237068 RepID=A0A8H4LDS1_9HYPO|nr:small s [Fusarium albosuccineum]